MDYLLKYKEFKPKNKDNRNFKCFLDRFSIYQRKHLWPLQRQPDWHRRQESYQQSCRQSFHEELDFLILNRSNFHVLDGICQIDITVILLKTLHIKGTNLFPEKLQERTIAVAYVWQKLVSQTNCIAFLRQLYPNSYLSPSITYLF